MITCTRSTSGVTSICQDPVFSQSLKLLAAHADHPPDEQSRPGGMGGLEADLLQDGNELLRIALEKAAQTRADRCPPVCRTCGTSLTKPSHAHERKVQSRFGPVVLKRTRGWCRTCQSWKIPADEELGLEERATASPGMQEISALLVSHMPATEAEKMARHLLGLPADDSTLAREARRQGEKAQLARQEADRLACSVEGRWSVTSALEDLPSDFTLVIMIDAWMIRERDEWGRTKELLEKRTPPSRWHWVYSATVFRLDSRGTTQSERPFIVSRGYVATRSGGEDFTCQLYAEAVRHGLLKAGRVLVVADGAAWIWNLVSDRFGQAAGRLDAMHAAQHLYAVADAVYGSGSEQGREWAASLREKMLDGDGSEVRQALSELLKQIDDETVREAVQSEANYFETHRDRMDYAQGRKQNEPIGSGAMESTCRQYQCRFKRCGMFWSTEGDEALLALETLWRNGRWETIFPHTARPSPTKSHLMN